MIKQIKTKLLFPAAAILMVTFAVTACNNKEEKTIKTQQTEKEKIDTADVSPGSDAKPQ